MSTFLRADLLRLVCSELPEPEAVFIRSLPPDDFRTHVEAYCTVRRVGIDLPEDLQRLLVTSLLAHMDSEIAASSVNEVNISG
jgi:hypothetical protein